MVTTGTKPAAALRNSIDLARHGGPAAVVLREATRRAGVVPNPLTAPIR